MAKSVRVYVKLTKKQIAEMNFKAQSKALSKAKRKRQIDGQGYYRLTDYMSKIQAVRFRDEVLIKKCRIPQERLIII